MEKDQNINTEDQNSQESEVNELNSEEKNNELKQT